MMELNNTVIFEEILVNYVLEGLPSVANAPLARASSSIVTLQRLLGVNVVITARIINHIMAQVNKNGLCAMIYAKYNVMRCYRDKFVATQLTLSNLNINLPHDVVNVICATLVGNVFDPYIITRFSRYAGHEYMIYIRTLEYNLFRRRRRDVCDICGYDGPGVRNNTYRDNCYNVVCEYPSSCRRSSCQIRCDCGIINTCVNLYERFEYSGIGYEIYDYTYKFNCGACAKLMVYNARWPRMPKVT